MLVENLGSGIRQSWIWVQSWYLKAVWPVTCNLCEFLWIWGDQSSQSILKSPWIFIGRADAEAPTLWPPDVKSQLIGKDPDAEKDWRQEEKGTTEDEMVGWHHWLNGHEFEWTPGAGDRQGRLACSSSWGCKELDMTERLNLTGNTIAFFLKRRQFSNINQIIA